MHQALHFRGQSSQMKQLMEWADTIRKSSRITDPSERLQTVPEDQPMEGVTDGAVAGHSLEQYLSASVAVARPSLKQHTQPPGHDTDHEMVMFCFVLFCLPCNSRCACGGMTTAETTFPPSNLGWLWPTCSPFVERGALCTECRPCHMGRRARALLTPYIEGDQLRLGAETHSPCERA